MRQRDLTANEVIELQSLNRGNYILENIYRQLHPVYNQRDVTHNYRGLWWGKIVTDTDGRHYIATN